MRISTSSSRRIRIIGFLTILVAAFAHSTYAQPTTITVGDDPAACDFTDLRSATDFLNSLPGEDAKIAHLTRESLFTSTAITLRADNMILRGGFENCEATVPSGRSFLTGASALGSVIRIEGGNAKVRQFRLEGLSIEDGDAVRGGGVNMFGIFDVTIANSLILGNQAVLGGGVHIGVDFRSTLRLIDTSINGNTADSDLSPPDGGGIYCEGRAAIVLEGTSSLIGNTVGAGGAGGGAFLAGCDLTATEGPSILLNRAHEGAGLFASAGSHVLIAGTESTAGRIDLNRAREDSAIAGDGGGIAATGTGTRVMLFNTSVSSNTAEPINGPGNGSGGGIFASEDAFVRMDRTLGQSCHDPDECSSLNGNEARRGAAAIAISGARIEIVRTVIDVNETVEPERGAIFEATGFGGSQPTRLALIGSTISRNSGGRLARLLGNLDLVLESTSVGGNFFDTGLIVVDGTTARTNIKRSLLFEPQIPLFDEATTETPNLQVDCLVADENHDLPAAVSVVTVDDPLFRNAEQGDLHLLQDSPAIDQCSGAPGMLDFDLDPRGIVNASGPLPAIMPVDAGADELGTDNVLFAGDFESGDFTQWSSSPSEFGDL